jgi:prepilin-type N-terminal cleavage/methylation domain-containing protein
MKKGFTLLELIIVIIVLGVLAAVALPQYFRVVERGRTAEAVSLLGLLRSAQVRYYAEKSAFATATGSLDVDFTTPKYYTITLANPAYAEGNVIVTAARNSVQVPAGYGGYSLTITVGGTVGCSGNATACASFGY